MNEENEQYCTAFVSRPAEQGTRSAYIKRTMLPACKPLRRPAGEARGDRCDA